MGENETPEYIFFIFDDNVMQQSEYDDIKEAILFHQTKPSFLDDDSQQIYLLFGHIVGIVKCTETLTCSLPSIIHLEKTRFAVIRITHYLLCLGYDIQNDIPDSCISRQLKKFLDAFAFYHGSFERLISTDKNDQTKFLLDLEHICSNYIAFAQGYDDDPIQSIFDPVPKIVFDRFTSFIFLKAARILEACQRNINVYNGCMFAESSVITSQIPSDLVHHLMLLKANKHVSIFYPGFDCPLGVRILRVYVTQQQYKEIVNNSPHKFKSKEVDDETITHRMNRTSINDNIGIRYDNNSSNSHLTLSHDEARQPTSTGQLVSDHKTAELLDDMYELHLYVQAHSNISLVLFMDAQESYDYQSLRSLWEMVLPHLGDLEAQINSLLSTSKENKSKQNEKVSFVKYDNIMDTYQTNISDIISAGDRAFSNSIKTIHGQFESSSTVSDITFIKSNLTYGYAHKSLIEEIYLQQRGDYKPSQSSPVNTDKLWHMDQQAGKMLKKMTTVQSNILL